MTFANKLHFGRVSSYIIIGPFLIFSVHCVLIHAYTSTNNGAAVDEMRVPNSPKSVAIIGAGAAGLATARVFARATEGTDCVIRVFEKHEKKDNRDRGSSNGKDDERIFGIGGVWHYEGSPPMSSNQKKNKPMYKYLRTNLPREIMGFRERPWGNVKRNDWRVEDSLMPSFGDPDDYSYPTHEEVHSYLSDYARHFNLTQKISFGCEIKSLQIVNQDDEWSPIRLEWSCTENESCSHEEGVFNIVCVANGHYAKPAPLTIIAKDDQSPAFKGTIMYAVEYDDPQAFEGKVVLCVGARASGSDLAREISQYASAVYLSDSTLDPLLGDDIPRSHGNVTVMPRTEVVTDEYIKFNGSSKESIVKGIDTIILCNGYDYDFPFINDGSMLGDDWSCVTGERRVAPLYEQLWHARYPSLAFVGLPHSVLPFPLFELQAEAIAAQFGLLPTLDNRMKAAIKDANGGGPNVPGRVQDTHFLGGFQWDYCRKMSCLAGNYDDRMEGYLSLNKAIYDHAGKERKSMFPGASDFYRKTRYERDDNLNSFGVVYSDVALEETNIIA